MGWVLIAAGLFSICGAASDWDWFMNSRKAALFVTLFHRTGARVVYALIGIGISVVGVLAVMGMISVSR